MQIEIYSDMTMFYLISLNPGASWDMETTWRAPRGGSSHSHPQVSLLFFLFTSRALCEGKMCL